MILGLDIVSGVIRLSARTRNGFVDRAIGGYDLTRPDRMNAEKLAECKDVIRETAVQLLGGKAADCAAAALPVSCGQTDWMWISMLLQEAGIPLIRCLNRSGAKGLYIQACSPTEMNHMVCCVGQNGSGAELAYMEISGGVTELLEQYSCPWEEFLPGSRIRERFCSAPAENHQELPEQVYLSDGLIGSEDALREWNVPGGFRMLDDFAAARGALIEAEIIRGSQRDWLLMDLFREDICLDVDGKRCTSLFTELSDSPGVTIPFKRMLRIPEEAMAAGSTLTLKMRNMHTGKVHELCTLPLDDIPRNGEWGLVIDLDFNRTITLELTVNGYPVRKLILPCSKG